jgi:integrase
VRSATFGLGILHPKHSEVTMPMVNLTAAFLATGLRCPEGKTRIEFCDTELPGLYVEVRATSPGQGTYYLRHKDTSGKTCHRKIGRTTDVGLTEARKAAKVLRGQVASGADLHPPKSNPKKEVPKWNDFFSQQYVPYAQPRKRSWPGDVQRNVRIQVKFGSRRLDEITRKEIEDFHVSLLAEGLAPATADQHLRLIKRVLNLAVAWEVIEKSPAANVKLLRVDNKRDFYLNDEQLQGLMGVLTTDSARTVCQLAMFLLSTGARLSEATGATWSQIDREHRLWRIPALNSKSKKMRAVPLNDQALAVLDQVGTEGEYEHVFINHRWINKDGSRGKPISWVHKVWERIRVVAGLPQLRIHDLRHSHASFLVNAGRSLYEVQQVLGHSDPAVTMRYAHLSTETMLAASNAASMTIERALKANQAARTAKAQGGKGLALGGNDPLPIDDLTQSTHVATGASGSSGETSDPQCPDSEMGARRAA